MIIGLAFNLGFQMILNNWVLDEYFDSDFKEKSNVNTNFCSPIIFKNFMEKHSNKSEILNVINRSSEGVSELKLPLINISNSDHHLGYETDREWLQKIGNDLKNNVLDLCISAGYNGYIMSAVWFQQYQSLANHEWHIHLGNHYSGVYYLEFPEDGPQTEFYNPLSKEVFTLGLKEGDIAIFPSYIPHRSPKNTSCDRKTIISFNIDFAFPDKSQSAIARKLS